MIWPRAVLVLLVVAILVGCGPVAPPPPRSSQPPRVRCLADPNERGTRPLIFFFCVESP